MGATTNNVAVPDLAFFSSRGPTFDTRFGIDVVAPGFYVSSAYSQVNAAANQCFIQGMAGTSMVRRWVDSKVRTFFSLTIHYPPTHPNAYIYRPRL